LHKFTINSLTFEQNKNNVLELCKNSDKPIVLMPAGQQSVNFYHYLSQHSIKIDFFVDNNSQKCGTTIQDIPVISFSEYKELSNKKFLIVATNENIEKLIIEQLEKNNIKSYKCIMADYMCFSANQIDNARKEINSNIEQYSKLYDMLEDDLSKNTLINRLNYLITYDKKYLKKVLRPLKNQYFEKDIYEVGSKDYFADCGAFDGDTLEQLLLNTNQNIAGYYGFEPDIVNYEKLCKKYSGYKNLEFLNKCLYKENAILRFNSVNNSSSQLNENGNIEIEAVSLDKGLDGKKVSVIKMDIEGGEYDALLGAKNIIASQKPLLAVSAYHKFDDIYRLAFLIESFGVKYKYYLRHYTMCSAETVLYAKE